MSIRLIRFAVHSTVVVEIYQCHVETCEIIDNSCIYMYECVYMGYVSKY